MPSLGELLRRERLKQGLDIEQVAARTRISGRFLEAIEDDDIGSLPGRFFYRSFVRQYASSLGLDESLFDDELQQVLTQEESEPAPPVLPPPSIEVPPIGTGSSDRTGRFPGSLFLLIAVVIGCAGLFALWQRSRMPAIPTTPEPVQTPIAAAAPETTVPGQAPVAGAPATAEPAQAPPTTAPAPPPASPEPAQQTPTEPPPAKPAPPPGPLGTGPMTVEVVANEAVWVSISTDGQNVVTRVLQPGDSRTVRGAREVKILSGNAGGMAVRVNGRPVEDVGPRGQVRTITVTPEGTQVTGPRRPEAASPPEQPQ